MKKSVKYVLGALIVGAISLLPMGVASKSNQPEKNVITLSKNNLVVLNDVVTGESVATLMQQAKEIDAKPSVVGHFLRRKPPGPIYLYLFTPGGSIQAGLELLEGLKGLRRPVNTITAFSASMGFQIAQNLGERDILQSGVMMSHMAAGGAEGYFNGTEASQLRRRLGLWESRIKEMDEHTVARTNGKQTMESYLKAYSPELWLTGTQSVDQGYADKIVAVRCDESLNGYSGHQAMTMFGPINYDLSDCPLNTTPINVRMSIFTNKGLLTFEQFTSQGGGFGAACLQYAVLDNTKVCAADTGLTLEKIVELKKKFLDRFTNIKDHVVPMLAE